MTVSWKIFNQYGTWSLLWSSPAMVAIERIDYLSFELNRRIFLNPLIFQQPYLSSLLKEPTSAIQLQSSLQYATFLLCDKEASSFNAGVYRMWKEWRAAYSLSLMSTIYLEVLHRGLTQVLDQNSFSNLLSMFYAHLVDFHSIAKGRYTKASLHCSKDRGCSRSPPGLLYEELELLREYSMGPTPWYVPHILTCRRCAIRTTIALLLSMAISES